MTAVVPPQSSNTAAPNQHNTRTARRSRRWCVSSISGNTAKPVLIAATGNNSHRASPNAASCLLTVLVSRLPPVAQYRLTKPCTVPITEHVSSAAMVVRLGRGEGAGDTLATPVILPNGMWMLHREHPGSCCAARVAALVVCEWHDVSGTVMGSSLQRCVTDWRELWCERDHRTNR